MSAGYGGGRAGHVTPRTHMSGFCEFVAGAASRSQSEGASQVDLSITRADHGERTVVHLGGEIDVYTAPLVREKLDEQIHAGRTDLVVDLSDVTFLDSTGLGVLVGRLKLTRTRGGSLRLVGTADRVLKVFAITGLDKVFEIHDTLEGALAATDAQGSAPGAPQRRY